MESIITKICTKCKIEKLITEFYKTIYKSPAAECKNCHIDRSRIRQKVKREEVNKSQHERYIKNPEKYKIRSALWVKRNPEKRSKASRKYHLSHPVDRLRQVITNHNRRARIKQNGGKVTKEEWTRILQFYNYTCLCCERNDVGMTMDHVIPIKFGGKHSRENLQPLCAVCNCRKQARTMDYRKRKIKWKKKE